MKLTKAQKITGLLRVTLGWIFLWAFLDKTFGLGFATAKENAWLLGGSPTSGFLEFATKGPFVDIFKAMSGNGFVDWLFMLGLLGVGISLMLGIGVKIGGYSGAAMLVLMFLAGFMPPEHNPILDDHLIYAILMVGLTFVNSGNWLGFGKRWSATKLVRKYPILK